jgi:hypothetical protein
MEIPPTAREALLSLSASDDTDGEEDDRVHTQDDLPPSTARSQPSSATKGPNTQELTLAESQIGSPARSRQTGSVFEENPETQDMAHVESQLGTPSQRASKSTTVRVYMHEATFENKKLGLSVKNDLLITDIVDKELAPGTEQVGDKLVAVNGKNVEKGTSANAIAELLASLPRPVKVTFARKVAENSVDHAIAINEDDNVVDLTQSSPSGSSKPSQSPLTGSSASRLASQPSQRSTGSQVSAGLYSPDLLASQPS